MMLRYGIDTIRIANADIDHNFYAVCVQIDYEIQRRMKALSVTAEPCQLPLKGEPGPDEP